MKKLLLSVFLSVSAAALSPVAQADNHGFSVEECEAMGVFAKSAMNARQGGVPLQDLMARNRKIEDDLVRDWMASIAMDAYDAPLIRSASNREMVATEFQNVWYLQCIQGKK